jgi:hypothetical protein
VKYELEDHGLRSIGPGNGRARPFTEGDVIVRGILATEATTSNSIRGHLLSLEWEQRLEAYRTGQRFEYAHHLPNAKLQL